MVSSFWAGVLLGPVLYSYVKNEVDFVKRFLWSLGSATFVATFPATLCKRKVVVPKFTFHLTAPQEVDSESEDEFEYEKYGSASSEYKEEGRAEEGPVATEEQTDTADQCDQSKDHIGRSASDQSASDQCADQVTDRAATADDQPSDLVNTLLQDSDVEKLKTNSTMMSPEMVLEPDVDRNEIPSMLPPPAPSIVSPNYSPNPYLKPDLKPDLKPVEVADVPDHCNSECYKSEGFLCVCRRRNWPSGYPAAPR